MVKTIDGTVGVLLLLCSLPLLRPVPISLGALLMSFLFVAILMVVLRLLFLLFLVVSIVKTLASDGKQRAAGPQNQS